MADTHNFEQIRRERLKKQREKRRRMQRIRLALLAGAALIVIILIISGISKCAKNSNDNALNNTDTAQITETQPPAATQQAVPMINNIPAPSAENNDMLTLIKNSGQKKHVYLTFDDGPSADVTPQILDILRRYNIKATFFMIGKNIEQNPDMCARVISEGHLAAPHSYSHEYSKVYASETDFAAELENTYNLIVSKTPGHTEPFKVFRFPGGSFTNGSYSVQKQQYIKRLAKEGFYYCDWNSMTGDTETGTTKTAEGLLSYFNNTRPQVNNYVIHMHDDDARQVTADMLESLIKQLLDEGYVFSRLDEIDFTNAPEATETATQDAAASQTPATEQAAPAATAAPTAATGTVNKNTKSTGKSTSSNTGSTASGTSKSTSTDTTATSGTAASGASQSNAAPAPETGAQAVQSDAIQSE